MDVFFTLFLFSNAIEEYGGEKSDILISYYSMIKLQHTETDLLLSSIELNYPSGSFQQMTRAIRKPVLAETYWTVFPMSNETEILQGKPIECGSTIRLNHATTKKWLHSHRVKTPDNKGFEVSCFDEDDEGNLWYLECNDMWTAGSAFRLQHVVTDHYLAVDSSSEYPAEQAGEHLVYASKIDEGNEWSIAGAITVDEN
ncbi:Stromal cell-derived factor 2-like protein [Histomonas meleagridis]|uniref:Stromal cell-derived factor 2-like protein n=1 Tax=Histomonas meleagridis TaxID=135588 RepID=UPI0035596734|nr:Stromal cell-derived factor 2-like protein [Histomonas meleagridis]KAH0796177.1 Stromal cell-derived factor 2-like protein [Histomonas meleagridis]